MFALYPCQQTNTLCGILLVYDHNFMDFSESRCYPTRLYLCLSTGFRLCPSDATLPDTLVPKVLAALAGFGEEYRACDINADQTTSRLMVLPTHPSHIPSVSPTQLS